MSALRPLLLATILTTTPAAASPPPSAQAGLQSPVPGARARAVEAVLARPESVDPFDYALVTKLLWESGRRRQAAFWFYLFQERSRPWSLADKAGSGAAALRSALNDELGTVVNRWVASDPVAWRALVERALAYEKRFPLYRERAPGIDATAWTALVASSRAEYDREARAAFARMDPAAFAAGRREAGLFVGPLRDPGPDLPDDWR